MQTAELTWDSLGTYSENVFGAVGFTPLIKVGRVARDVEPEIFAKIEWFSPTGSLKDRIYAQMISRAEERGELREGTTILECSSGNAGIACAAAAAIKNYDCIIVMPEMMSAERKKMIHAYGAELITTPGGESDVDVALKRMKEMAASAPERYWVPGEFENLDNVDTHYTTSGPEIWTQIEGSVDALIAAVGTGGWLTGVGRYLREKNPALKIYGVEPTESPLISEGNCCGHGIAGIGDGLIPNILDLSLLDGIITSSTEEALRLARSASREEGLFCGISSGCNLAAALKFARSYPEVDRIVTIFGDTGQRYFSTPLCHDESEMEVALQNVEEGDREAMLKKFRKTWDIID
jgi:cysteine synthase A